MEKEWIVRALAMHAALRDFGADASTEDVKVRAEHYAAEIAAFAQAALNKPADPFS